MRLRLFVTVVIVSILAGCGSGKEAHEDNSESDTDYRTEIRLQQYMVQGKQLYKAHCSNCHQPDGSGLAQLYPPLAKSDFLTGNLERAACVIQNGLSGEITVNSRSFNQPMPANDNLTSIEVAEILTYISNAWGNEAGISSTRDVSLWLKKCDK